MRAPKDLGFGLLVLPLPSRDGAKALGRAMVGFVGFSSSSKFVNTGCRADDVALPSHPLGRSTSTSPSPFILEVQRRHRHPNRLLTHTYITCISQNGAPPRERRFGATNIASEDILLYNIFIFLITSTAADRYPTRHFHY
ncbi:hypothetical protein HYQ46_001808 [Verticillium longisporum]|nr:hypothetical protein HYQ46_001808 [Verticillium longisporum]